MNKNDNKDKWTAKRILALIGIILLLALYGSTMVFALMDSPNSKGLFMASIFATFAIPILIYAMTLVAGRVRDSAMPQNTIEQDDTEDK
ncbi:MAG: hypothetical protein Q4B22_07100 [Eubacteriales bacterium]|nr:hypothetical protein [Eubacteriales bacterium]